MEEIEDQNHRHPGTVIMKAVEESPVAPTGIASHLNQSKNHGYRTILASHKQLAGTPKKTPPGTQRRPAYRTIRLPLGKPRSGKCKRKGTERKKEKKKSPRSFLKCFLEFNFLSLELWEGMVCLHGKKLCSRDRLCGPPSEKKGVLSANESRCRLFADRCRSFK